MSVKGRASLNTGLPTTIPTDVALALKAEPVHTMEPTQETQKVVNKYIMYVVHF